jgi:hypothetical protein
MICPYCQADLDPATLSCPRCGAAYPGARGGAVLGTRLRMLGIAFVVLVMPALILVVGVRPALPAGGQAPQARSEGAQRALRMMMQHQQESENPAPPPPRH